MLYLCRHGVHCFGGVPVSLVLGRRVVNPYDRRPIVPRPDQQRPQRRATSGPIGDTHDGNCIFAAAACSRRSAGDRNSVPPRPHPPVVSLLRSEAAEPPSLDWNFNTRSPQDAHRPIAVLPVNSHLWPDTVAAMMAHLPTALPCGIALDSAFSSSLPDEQHAPGE